MDRNVKIAKELVRMAKELVEGGNSYDSARFFEKALKNPTPHNVNKFTKSLSSPAKAAPSPKPAKPAKSANDELGQVAQDLAELAQELLDSDEGKKEE